MNAGPTDKRGDRAEPESPVHDPGPTNQSPVPALWRIESREVPLDGSVRSHEDELVATGNIDVHIRPREGNHRYQ